MTRKILLAILALLLCAGVSHAQSKKKKKDEPSTAIRTEEDGTITVEFDVEESESHRSVTLGDLGTIVYYSVTEKSIKTYEFIYFDKDLQEKYRTSYALPKQHSVIARSENNGIVYLLTGATKANDFITKYTIIKFDPILKEIKTFEGSTNKKGGYVNSFRVANDIAYIYLSKSPSPGTLKAYFCINYLTCFIPAIIGLTKITEKPEMIIHNIAKKSQRSLNFDYEKRKGNIVIQSVSINDSTNECTMLLNARHKKMNTSWIRTADVNGKLSKDVMIKTSPDKVMSGMRISQIEDKKVFYGIYEAPSKKVTIGRANPSGVMSLGVCYGVIGNNGVEKITYTPYKNLTNFKMPLSRREAKQIKKNSKKGKETSISLQVHYLEPLQFNDEVILIGEVYYATYRTETRTTYVNGRPQTTTVTVFDGWAFSHILFTAYNLQGNLLWTNSIPYSRAKSYFIYDRVKATLNDDGSIQVVYNDGTNIKTAVVNKTEVVESSKTITIKKTRSSGDKVTFQGGADVVYWYDNYYLVYGFVDIKNKQKKGKDKKREVYYVKRIEVE